MKTCVCRYVRLSRLGCGVKWSFRETKVGRRLHFQKHVCGHHWYSGGRTHQGQGCCFRRWSWCIFIDIVYVAYIFLCTKKYPILLFFFDKRVRIGDTKTKNLQCIENQGFEKNFMFLQTTGWVGLGSGDPRAGAFHQVLVLVQAHWQAEPSPGVWLQGQEVPELVSNHWWVGPVPDTFGCKVWGSQNLCWSAGGWVGPTGYKAVVVLGLMFTHWCVKLGFSHSQGLLVSGLVGCEWLQLFWGCCLPTGEWGWFRA